MSVVLGAILLAPMVLPATSAGADSRAKSRSSPQAQEFAQADLTTEDLLRHRGSGKRPAPDRTAAPAGLRLRSGDAAGDLTRRSECYIDAHFDDLDGSAIDVSDYGMLYECEFADEWAFLIRTADTWATSALDDAALYLDADGRAGTGCGGFEYLILAFETTQGLVAGLFRTPTCDSSHVTYVVDVEVARPSGQSLAVFFDNRLIGDPDAFFWAADVTAQSDASPDFLPNNAFHEASGFKVPSQACAPASQGYILSSNDPEAAQVLMGSGATSVRRIGMAVTFSGNVEGAVSALRRAGVEGRIEPNDLMKRLASPNDLTSAQWAPSQVSAAGAWDVTRGSSQIAVGVIDSGIDATHPDLQGKVQPGYDAFADTTLPSGNSDKDGHGTSVASVIGAATDNGGGIAGLGWNTPVAAIRPDDADGSISAAAVAAGIRWGADRGLRVLNISLGSCSNNQAIADAVAYALSRGTLVVAAAGNEAQEGNPVTYPAALEGVLAVGATGFSGNHAPYSNTGSYVDLVAPGGSAGADRDIAHGMLVLAPAGQVTRVDGTSFSAPMVAAGAALVLSVNPQLSPAQVTQILVSTARDLGAAGRDDIYGAGMLNLERAVRAAGSGPTPAPTPSSNPASPSPNPSATGSPSAAPAPPPSSPAPTADDIAPSVAVSRESISAGEAITVTYRGHPDTEIRIYSRTQPATEFSYIRSVLLDANGFGSSTHAPQKNTRITAASSSGHYSVNAPIIAVRSVASFNANRVGARTYTFTGRVYPALNQRLVNIYRNGSLVAQARSDATGIYKVTRTLGAGTFTFQARTPNDQHNLGTTSPSRSVRIY